MSKERKNKVKIGITMGDPNGVGFEVIMKAFSDPRMFDSCIPVVYGSSKIASYHRKALNLGDFNFNIVNDADEAVSRKPNLINCWEEEVKVDLGVSDNTAGKYAFHSLEAATRDLASNKVDVLVTAPINKHNIQSEDFNFPGHTEYLADYANEANPLMIMVHDKMRVGVVTGHIPLEKVASTLNSDLILGKLRVLNRSLIVDFNIRKPKIAVLGLNPHASDRGLIGNEEQEIIIPALNRAKDEDILAFGPYSADGFFGSSAFTQFDGILAMYHDQGLVPFKALSFGNGVNYTAGLPIVRTSPDHGTGYDIAGKNQASAGSFRNAVYMACDILDNRREYKELTANPLTPQKAGHSKSK